MDKIFETLKTFLIENVNSEIAKLEESSLSLPPMKADFIKFGTVDVSKTKGKIIVSILPENQEEETDDIGDYKCSNKFLITFIVSGVEQTKLLKRCCRYVSAFRNALLASPDLNGEVSDTVLGERTFYPDAGTTEGQLSAVEIDLTVLTDTEI